MLAAFKKRQAELNLPGGTLDALNEYIGAMPVEFLDLYKKNVGSAVSQQSGATFLKATEGLAFQLSRLAALLPATAAGSVYKLKSDASDIPNPARLTYNTYTTRHVLPKEREIKLESDIPLFRDGKPLIYDTKADPVQKFGGSQQNRDQLIKYQAAIDHRLIDGAVIEVKGRIDNDFLGWVLGVGIGNPSPVPDVQIICCVPLPSGAEFRFDLKRCHNPLKTLSYYNDASHYSMEDRAVAQGFMRALRSPDKSVIVDLLGQHHVEQPSPELAHYLEPENLEAVTEAGIYLEYKSKSLSGLWQAAKAARQPKYNTENKTTAVDPKFAEPDSAKQVIRDIIESYQQSLHSNPDLAKVKSSYYFGDPGKNGKAYEAKTNGAVDFMFSSISLIRSQELKRQHADDFTLNAELRRKLGWVGKPEGLALDTDHLLLDAILETQKKGAQKGRSYLDADKRFLNLDQVMGELTPERDEAEQSFTSFDPLSAEQKPNIQKDMTDKKLARAHLQMLLTNLDRANTFITALKDEPAAGHDAIARLAADVPLAVKADMLKGAQQCKRHLSLIEQNRVQMDDAGTAVAAAYAQKADTDSMAALQAQRLAAEQAYHQSVALLHDRQRTQIIGKDIWSNMAIRSQTKKTNLAKYIYVVVPVRQPDDTIRDEFRFAPERINSTTTGRAAHSELAGGLNTYGAGEIIFEKTPGDGWALCEINNGSGHYRPEIGAIDYVSKLFKQRLADHFGRAQGAAYSRADRFMSRCHIVDSLAPGMDVTPSNKISSTAGSSLKDTSALPTSMSPVCYFGFSDRRVSPRNSLSALGL